MPLYEYLCHRCGKSFDVLQKFSDEPLTLHPECGGEVERLVSAPTLKFKGSGWYINDYGSGSFRARSQERTRKQDRWQAGVEAGNQIREHVRQQTRSCRQRRQVTPSPRFSKRGSNSILLNIPVVA